MKKLSNYLLLYPAKIRKIPPKKRVLLLNHHKIFHDEEERYSITIEHNPETIKSTPAIIIYFFILFPLFKC